MSKTPPADQWTTASVETIPRLQGDVTETPGLILVYSRLHAHLPTAVPLSEDVLRIGREADNDLCIPEAAVSRYHARIECADDGTSVHDLGSTNGTLVNGRRVERVLLVDHDVIRIGDTIFRFASADAYRFGAYRPDGTVIEEARPVRHGIGQPLLVGGLQIDILLERIAKVAPTGLAVVVTGESGTGKELVARQIHLLSGRSGAFQAINCAALPPNLIESELFGYRKGAFTGASADKRGLVRGAHEGTLFLDEIGDMPLEAQAKLLRVLQEKEVLPLGATTPERVDVRVACATHRDLDAYVEAGRFRGDLLGRLRECALTLPPLRQRREDLMPLVTHFLRRAGRTDAHVGFSYMLALAHYEWPYNVRELESAVRLSLALAEGDDLDLVHLPENLHRALESHGTRAVKGPRRPGTTEPPADATISASGPPTEARLRELLTRHAGNIAAVGRELGKERMQIHRWLKRYDIDVNEYRR